MRLWRISNYADLKGIGGLRTPGRWHNRGIPIVYLSESPALALLEVLVHFELDSSEVPDNFRLLEVEYSQRKGVSRLSAQALAENWREQEDVTRALGDDWLAAMSSVMLRVPSAIVPASYNYLFNPRHPLAREASIVSVIEHPYDQRFWR